METFIKKLELSNVFLEELSEIYLDLVFLKKQPFMENYSWLKGKRIDCRFRNIHVRPEDKTSNLINYHVFDHGHVIGSLNPESLIIVGEREYTNVEIRKLRANDIRPSY